MSCNSDHVEEYKALLNLLDSSVCSYLIKFAVWLVEVTIFKLEFERSIKVSDTNNPILK